MNESFGDGKSLWGGPNTHIMEIHFHTPVQLCKASLCIVDGIFKRLERQLDKFTPEGSVSTSCP